MLKFVAIALCGDVLAIAGAFQGIAGRVPAACALFVASWVVMAFALAQFLRKA
jgi:hypothetical protein